MSDRPSPQEAAPAGLAADVQPAAPAGSPAADPAAQIGDFLRSRRGRVRPQDVGLPPSARHRRVPGLRREELAQLAGVSVAYLTRLEQGRGANVSAGVLDALARALQLSPPEHAHLTRLARRQGGPEPAADAAEPAVRPALRQLLQSIEGVPAYVAGPRCDLLAWNRAAAVLFGDWSALPAERRNWARLVFLDADFRALLADWERAAADAVGDLRLHGGRHPDDPALAALVQDLSAASGDFRRLWASHDVAEVGHGTLRLRHPRLGAVALAFETMQLPGGGEQCLTVCHAPPGSPTDVRLRRLATAEDVAPPVDRAADAARLAAIR